MDVLLRVSFAVYFIGIGICTDMPRFSYKSKDCELIHYGDGAKWQTGCPTTAAVLNYRVLELHINTEGDIISQRTSIFITCPGSSRPIKLRLLQNASTSTTFCKMENFPVELRHDASSPHLYKLVPDYFETDIQNLFRHHLVISVEVEAVTSSRKIIVLKSNLLYVYTIQFKNSRGTGVITSEAKDFLKYAPYPSTEPFPKIQFLNKDLSASLQSAFSNTFFEHLLEFGAVRDFASNNCVTSLTLLNLLVVNRMTDRDNTADQMYYHLDISDGTLLFSRAGISALILSEDEASIKKNRDDEGSVCTYIALGALAKRRRSVKSNVFTSNEYDRDSYKILSRRFTCVKAVSASVEDLTLFAGMARYALKCPIICDFDAALEFKHGSRTLLPTPNRRYNGQLEIGHNYIMLPEHLKASDNGIYTCRYSDSSVDLQHAFNVSVVSLPTFQTKENPEHDGSLPPVIYAVEGESLSYSCTVFYHGLPVTLAPEIFHSSSSHGWSGPLSQSDYNIYLFTPGATESTVKEDRRVGASTLTVKVKEVPSMDRSTIRNFTHRFHCKASVPETDKHLRILNMKDYTVVSGSSVFYIPKLTSSHIIASPHNKCSMERCNSEAGASYSFKFSPEFAAYMRKIGVKVTGYFMLDDLNVASIPVIKPEYSTLKEAKDFELKLTIPSITEDLLSELQERKTLTAVYNFNYNSNELHAGLQLQKSKYGKAREADDEDCRSDKLKTCFYSTSFPAYMNDSSLDFLTTYFYFI